MIKKMIVLSLCFVIIAAATVGGTIAVSKSSDGSMSGYNTVLVRLLEEQRSADGGFEKHVSAMDFFSDPGAFAGSPRMASKIAVSRQDGLQLSFWDQLSCAKDKIVSIKNTSKTDAYIRVVFAFEDTNGIEEKLHLNVMDESAMQAVCRVTVNGTPYRIYTYTYDEPLKAGETSAPSLLQFVFDTSLSRSDVEAAGGQYDMLVVAQAVQTGGFSDATSALNAVFGVVSEENHPWK